MKKRGPGYNDYMRQYMAKRYRERMDLAIDRLGGKCSCCGSIDRLELDHIDRTSKSFTLAKLWNVPIDIFLSEVDKCQLLCDPCHNNKTLKEKGQKRAMGTHGTISAVRYCKPLCDLCRTVKNQYTRDWKRKRREQFLGV